MRKCCKKMQATTALEPIYFNEQINLSFTPNCQPTLIHTHTHTTDMQMKKAMNRQKQSKIKHKLRALVLLPFHRSGASSVLWH